MTKHLGQQVGPLLPFRNIAFNQAVMNLSRTGELETCLFFDADGLYFGTAKYTTGGGPREGRVGPANIKIYLENTHICSGFHETFECAVEGLLQEILKNGDNFDTSFNDILKLKC